MKQSSDTTNNKTFWKSLREYYDDPEIFKNKVNEFKDGVTDDFDPSELSGVSRRKFLALLTASAAFTATACSDYRDKGEIVPFNKRPEEIVPGEANYYASTCNGCSQSCGILIKTREGRPIKIDGNPEHPISQGKICTTAQASILNLYDPDRLTDPMINSRKVTWERIDSSIVDELNNAVKLGKEIAIISEAIVSPSTKNVIDDFIQKYSSAKLYTYSLLNDKNRREAWLVTHNSYNYPAVKLDEAEIVVSLDSDFLGSEGNFIENLRLFSKKREVVSKTDFNRLYVAEGRMSLTGSLADYRIQVSPADQLSFVYYLMNELVKTFPTVLIDSSASSILAKYSSIDLDASSKEKVNHLLIDIKKNFGKTLFYAGDTLNKDVHIAVNLLNEIVGANRLYDYSSTFKIAYKYSATEEISSLVSSMKNGKVGALLHFDTNPVFSLSPEFEYSSALKKVDCTISLTEADNETSALCKYKLPINNPFESWGDFNSRNGIYSTQQPVIEPLFNTREKESILLNWIAGNSSKYNPDLYRKYIYDRFVKEIFPKANSATDEKTFWYSVLHEGVLSTIPDDSPKNFNSKITLSEAAKSNDNYSLHLTSGYYIKDGRFANNGWLQEIPHPISKVAWDNYASISPQLANKLEVELSDVIEISVNGKNLSLPVVVQPGVAKDVIHVELGYGRTVVGEVGKGVGFNTNNLLTKDQKYIYENVSVKKTGSVYKLASTQEHHSLDDTFVKDFHRIRKIIQDGTVEEYKNDPEFLHHKKHKIFSITEDHAYTGNKWAMAIDLNKCTNCSACIASCNVENNIPIVGKDQVSRGREMQWMRLDRYYSGTPDEPIVSNQPMLCQHCDNAPCENVCPVNATNHSPDGLNQMVYNRCVGTRYCSNNCPYKVRRYNFYNFRDNFADAYYENKLTSLVHNPEVTVRSRGVMEKCTFCVQRIMDARSIAIKEGRALKGEDVVTACQSACPTNAIVFGDANDKNSAVAKLRDHKLAYHVLEELNVKPNVTYIAKLRNIHSEDVN
jgi:molybdopterin-containing oxidoreductase family iron-sulfur binding subunit